MSISPKLYYPHCIINILQDLSIKQKELSVLYKILPLKELLARRVLRLANKLYLIFKCHIFFMQKCDTIPFLAFSAVVPSIHLLH